MRRKSLACFVKLFVVIGLLFLFLTGFKSAPKSDLKIFISVDMEGIAGVVAGQECSSKGADYNAFRKVMTLETNAAIEAALEAGATEIVVRDGHGRKTNIIPTLLHKKAKLMRGVTDHPQNMMLGIDGSFDGVMFIGHHAKAGTEGGILAHTSSGNVIDLSVNGVSLPEIGYNSVLAGLHDVPVLLVAGDNWICDQAKALFGDVVTVQTKVGFGSAALCDHPDVVNRNLRKGVKDALSRIDDFKVYKLVSPYKMVLKVKKERDLFPGAKKVSKGAFSFTSDDFHDVMDAFNAMK